MESPQIKQKYTSEDFDIIGFHDCYVHAIRWIESDFLFVIELDYILKWIEIDKSYKFWVVPAELVFEYPSEVNTSIRWHRERMECQIAEFYKKNRKAAPDGSDIFLWEIEFSRPDGSIAIWAADFRLSIQGTPVLSDVQNLRQTR